jgi:hypothetical protein
MLGFHHDDERPTLAAPPREPVDETLLRAPEFSTDEFRIYKFKVREGRKRRRKRFNWPHQVLSGDSGTREENCVGGQGASDPLAPTPRLVSNDFSPRFISKLLVSCKLLRGKKEKKGRGEVLASRREFEYRERKKGFLPSFSSDLLHPLNFSIPKKKKSNTPHALSYSPCNPPPKK